MNSIKASVTEILSQHQKAPLDELQVKFYKSGIKKNSSK